MHVFEKIEIIKNKFRLANYEILAVEISNRQSTGGTPGERFEIVVHYLNQIKNTYTQAYKEASVDIDELIDYAKSINYL